LAGPIRVTNLADGKVFAHRLVRIVGHADTIDAPELTVVQEANVRTASTAVWPMKEGHFKAFVLLERGDNVIRLRTPADTVQLRLRHQPGLLDGSHHIRLCYVRAKDEDGSSAAAPGCDGSPEATVRRIRLLGYMMQCFMAEKLEAAGVGHRTFSLLSAETEPAEPMVDIHVSPLTRREINALGKNWSDGGLADWAHFATELSGSRRNTTIDVALLATTRRAPSGCSPVPDHGFLAHTALGGSGLALFGGASLAMWATEASAIVRCFNDERRCDQYPEIKDDSCGRGTFWATYSTTAGAVLHELGHSLGLPHTTDGIMFRGFDNFNRYFAVTGPGMADPVTPDKEAGAYWHPDSVRLLALSPFLKTRPNLFRRVGRFLRRLVR
jgi:hypothetical protein